VICLAGAPGAGALDGGAEGHDGASLVTPGQGIFIRSASPRAATMAGGTAITVRLARQGGFENKHSKHSTAAESLSPPPHTACVCMSIHPDGKSNSHIGRVLALNAPSTWVDADREAGAAFSTCKFGDVVVDGQFTSASVSGKGATVVCVTPTMDHPLTAPLTVSLDGHEYSDNAVDIEFTPVKLEPLVGWCRLTPG